MKEELLFKLEIFTTKLYIYYLKMHTVYQVMELLNSTSYVSVVENKVEYTAFRKI